jgi:DNA-binding response OmpR family regulator
MPQSEPHSILVVEDYVDLRNTIADLLTRNNWVCDSVDIDGAVEKLRSCHYEMILLGPRLSIADDPVLHYLAEYEPGELAHVVVMTNPVTEDESPDARCQVLPKPFSMEELLAAVTASTV